MRNQQQQNAARCRVAAQQRTAGVQMQPVQGVVQQPYKGAQMAYAPVQGQVTQPMYAPVQGQVMQPAFAPVQGQVMQPAVVQGAVVGAIQPAMAAQPVYGQVEQQPQYGVVQGEVMR